MRSGKSETAQKQHRRETRTMTTLTIAHILERLTPHIGTVIACPLTANKGAVGLLCETILGIPHSPRCLDCADGEVKTFPVMWSRRVSAIIPKETLAVTMLDPTALKDESFEESRVYRKMTRMLCIPYKRTDDTVVFYSPTLIELEKSPALCARIATDYNAIRSHYISTGILTSSIGAFLQNRTKGSGHGSTSRAFYLKKEFMLEHCSLPVPD
jgi:DNA mismatch repair protein MutH